VGGPGSCFRGSRAGAIRRGDRSGVRQGSPAEGLRSRGTEMEETPRRPCLR
jgi:hypothetical protein